MGAYGSEEEATFLATQQVDEARHMQFYARFQDEVVAEPAAIAAHVARAREQVSPAFGRIFDDALVEAHERLVRTRRPGREGPLRDDLPPDPRGTLGLTSYRFVTRYLEREGLLPGFVEGYSQDPPRRDAPHRLRRVVPARDGARAPRGGGRGARGPARSAAVGGRVAVAARHGGETDCDALGASADDIRAFALDGLTRRLDIIGVPLATL